MRILKDFKSFVFGSADSKRVTGAFFVSADSKGFSAVAAFGGRIWEKAGGVASVRINVSDNTGEDSMLITFCQGPIREKSVGT